MKRSDALDLEHGVFQLNGPWKIAESLKQAAMRSKRRKGTPYQSAMAMLNFYINRAGKTLTAGRKRILERLSPSCAQCSEDRSRDGSESGPAAG